MPVLYLTDREHRLVRNLVTEFSERIAGQLRTRADLTPAGRDRYIADLDDGLAVMRKIKHAEGAPCTVEIS